MKTITFQAKNQKRKKKNHLKQKTTGRNRQTKNDKKTQEHRAPQSAPQKEQHTKQKLKKGKKRAKSYNKNIHIRRNGKTRNFPKTEQKKKTNGTKTEI